MSLERNEKSDDGASSPRKPRRWAGVVFGVLLGWAALALFAVASKVLPPTTYTYDVIFVKIDMPEGGVSKMRLNGRYMEHLFVSPYIVVTRERTASTPTATLTFDFHRTREGTPEGVSVELAVEELWRRGCTTEIVLTDIGASSRGCLRPIKQLF